MCIRSAPTYKHSLHTATARNIQPYQEQRHPLRKRVFNALLGNRIVMTASRVVAASEAEANNLRSRWPKAQVEVVPPGAATYETTAASPLAHDETLQDWLSAEQGKRVIYVSRLANKKRPDILVSAWRLVEDNGARLLIVGREEDFTISELRELAGDHSQKHLLLGHRSHSEALGLLSLADIFALPTQNENFGIAVVEAMGQACAVIVTDRAASSRYVEDTGAGLV